MYAKPIANTSMIVTRKIQVKKVESGYKKIQAQVERSAQSEQPRYMGSIPPSQKFAEGDAR